MWQSFKQKILQVNRAAAAEIIIQADDTWRVHICRGRTKKGAALAGEFSMVMPDQSLEKIKNDIPFALVLNGKGVLTKMLPSSQRDNALSTVLPGANPSDFYYEIYQVGNKSVISIIRKEIMDNILARLKDNGIKLLSVSLGFSPLTAIVNYLPTDVNEIETTTFRLQLKDKKELVSVESVNKNDTGLPGQPEYLISGQYIKAFQLLSFAAFINLLADTISEPAEIPSPFLADQRNDYVYYKYFRFASFALLSALFIVLLSSFLVYSHYFGLNNEMQGAQSLNDMQNQKARKTESDIRQKEKFLGKSGWVNPGKASYYADRIAALTPGDVLLKSMNIYPLRTSSFTSDGPVVYKKDTVEIAGICYDPVALNQFISGLRIIPDFSKVTVKSYQYRKEEEAGAFVMEVITK